MKYKSILILLCAGLFVACNNDDEETIIDQPDPPSPPAYFIASEGSYWVYDTYRVEGSGSETLHRQNDTLFALGDTMIADLTYQMFFGRRFSWQAPSYQFLRDSAGFIFNHASEEIVWSYTNFDDTLSMIQLPTVYMNEPPVAVIAFISKKMEKVEGTVVLPAGTFANVINAKSTVQNLTHDWNGITNNYYAPAIGQITRTYFYLGQYIAEQRYYEERLVAYHIVP